MEFLYKIKEDPKAFLMKIWRPMIYIAVVIVLFAFCMRPIGLNPNTEYQAFFVGIAAPIFFTLLFYHKQVLTAERTEKISLYTKGFLIASGSFGIIAYIVFLILQLNMVANPTSTTDATVNSLITTCYISAIFIFIFWIIELINIKKLNAYFIATYFLNAGFLAMLCCNIGVISTFELTNANDSIYYKEAMAGTTSHILIGLGFSIVMLGLIVIIQKVKQARENN